MKLPDKLLLGLEVRSDSVSFANFPCLSRVESTIVLTGDVLGSVAFDSGNAQLLDDRNNEQLIPPFNRLDAWINH